MGSGHANIMNIYKLTAIHWIVRYVKFHGAKTHPKDMGKTQVEAFLSLLATQRQAHNAIVFLNREVLLKPIESQIAPIRAKGHPRVPVVMTQAEVKRVPSFTSRTHLLMAKLFYGSGLRLTECVRLWVQNLDFTFRPTSGYTGQTIQRFFQPAIARAKSFMAGHNACGQPVIGNGECGWEGSHFGGKILSVVDNDRISGLEC